MLIKRLGLKNILSFRDAEIELGQLNVLIGPNAVGKSNLIDVVGLLRAAPAELALAGTILRGGGIRQWLWLGSGDLAPLAKIHCELLLGRGRQTGPVAYELQFSEDAAQGFVILAETIMRSGAGLEKFETVLSRSYNSATLRPENGKPDEMTVPAGLSILSQFKSPVDPTPITEIGNHFGQIRIFREFRTGLGSAARHGVSTTVPKDALDNGGDNLALVLSELDFLGVHDRIRHYLQRFCERFEDLKVRVGEGLARINLREAGLKEPLSGIRMSDGTLKFIAILAALFHPNAPPLMCIEEPEVGLHPDAMQLVAEALLEASESTQLIVTTHSDALVDALTDRPDTVLVCERDFDNGTQMKHLSKDDLKEWLEHYTLGQLWRKGEIGGGRW